MRRKVLTLRIDGGHCHGCSTDGVVDGKSRGSCTSATSDPPVFSRMPKRRDFPFAIRLRPVTRSQNIATGGHWRKKLGGLAQARSAQAGAVVLSATAFPPLIRGTANRVSRPLSVPGSVKSFQPFAPKFLAPDGTTRLARRGGGLSACWT